MVFTVNLYRKGRIAEEKVASDLRSKGFQKIRKSSGSKGSADIYASKNGQKYYFWQKGHDIIKEWDKISSE